MSVRRLDPNQPREFKFSPENLAWARDQIKKYPEGRQAAAVLPLLWRAQEQHDQWLPEPAIRYVAEMLDMAYIRVYEIATFYTMFNLSPVGRYHIQVCGTTPCMLRGANDLKKVCERVIGPKGRVTPEGVFSWIEVECLGACVNAPMIQVNKDYYEDLTVENFEALLEGFRRGRTMKTGPQTDRHMSAPASGQKTLLDPEIYKPVVHETERSAPRAAHESRTVDKAQAATETAFPVKTPEVKSGDTEKAREMREGFLARPDGAPDDLTSIGGIDGDAQKMLNEIGLYHFRQVSRWTKEDEEWVETRLPRFKGKTAEWVEKAKALIDTKTPGAPAPDVSGTRQGKDAND